MPCACRSAARRMAMSATSCRIAASSLAPGEGPGVRLHEGVAVGVRAEFEAEGTCLARRRGVDALEDHAVRMLLAVGHVLGDACDLRVHDVAGLCEDARHGFGL